MPDTMNEECNGSQGSGVSTSSLVLRLHGRRTSEFDLLFVALSWWVRLRICARAGGRVKGVRVVKT